MITKRYFVSSLTLHNHIIKRILREILYKIFYHSVHPCKLYHKMLSQDSNKKAPNMMGAPKGAHQVGYPQNPTRLNPNRPDLTCL